MHFCWQNYLLALEAESRVGMDVHVCHNAGEADLLPAVWRSWQAEYRGQIDILSWSTAAALVSTGGPVAQM